MTLNQLRTMALWLPGAMEAPHFHMASFRVRGKIFMAVPPGDAHVHVFVGEAHREPVLARYPEWVEKLPWGGKIVGLRIELAKADASVVKTLVRVAWEAKAPTGLR